MEKLVSDVAITSSLTDASADTALTDGAADIDDSVAPPGDEAFDAETTKGAEMEPEVILPTRREERGTDLR